MVIPIYDNTNNLNIKLTEVVNQMKANMIQNSVNNAVVFNHIKSIIIKSKSSCKI